jgi:hypothetical protein
MILGSDDSLFILIEAVKLILVLVGLVGISEDLLGGCPVVCDNVTEIAVLIGF